MNLLLFRGKTMFPFSSFSRCDVVWQVMGVDRGYYSCTVSWLFRGTASCATMIMRRQLLMTAPPPPFPKLFSSKLQYNCYSGQICQSTACTC